MNIFDGYRDAAFDIVTTTMGYAASWVPSDGSFPAGHQATVLLNNPTEERTLSAAEYSPYAWQMEYRRDYFPGLTEAVRSGLQESVTINSQAYLVRDIHTKFDGNNVVAALEPINP